MKKWQQLLQQGYDKIESLQEVLSLQERELNPLCEIQEEFPLFINPYYLSLIDPSDPEDPIRKMSIPGLHEKNRMGSFDTSGEHSNTVLPGLQHKYRETALVLSTNQCAMYCRHCFRKRMVGSSAAETCASIGDVAAYVQGHPEISNVLISGGDAFMNSNETISRYLSALCPIPHLDLIRFGTRMPVVLPQRITSDPELVEILESYSAQKAIYVVTQFNHPREVTREAAHAIQVLLKAGVPVRNQTVLLKGVNDSSAALGTLLKELTSIGVIPYYIFQCRPVKGVMNHFQVPLREGYRTVREASGMQNGIGKCFRFMMSHVTGKIEIIGEGSGCRMIFKYHQAKDPKDAGRLFEEEVTDSQCWL